MKRKQALQDIVEYFHTMHRGLIQRGTADRDAIPHGQKAALFIVATHKFVNIKTLATVLHVTPGAATQHIEALVQAGLVVRKEDPTDRRNVTITLSSRGETLRAKFQKNRMSLLHEIFDDISDEELKIYHDITQKISLKIVNPKQK